MNRDQAKQMYKSMYRIRRFEETCHELYLAGKIPGMSPHLYIGEEAVAAGVCLFLGAPDYIVSTHRGHGYCLAKGARMDRMLAEILGRETGYCRGRRSPLPTAVAMEMPFPSSGTEPSTRGRSMKG